MINQSLSGMVMGGGRLIHVVVVQHADSIASIGYSDLAYGTYGCNGLLQI